MIDCASALKQKSYIHKDNNNKKKHELNKTCRGKTQRVFSIIIFIVPPRESINKLDKFSFACVQEIWCENHGEGRKNSKRGTC